MKNKIVRTIADFYRNVLKVRYKVHISGAELFDRNKTYLIMPNHQASIDPQILYSHLLKYINPAPLVTEGYFKIPIVAQILAMLDAVKVPDLEKSRKGIEIVRKLDSHAVDALRQGKSIVIYPSGQLASQGYERINNKQMAWNICCNLPDNVRIIGTRMHGLWGSVWSKEWTGGKSPNFLWTYIKSIFYVLANFIFFCPKRSVNISFHDITTDALQKAKENRLAFNHYLENFYNIHGEETPKHISHFFFSLKRRSEVKNEK